MSALSAFAIAACSGEPEQAAESPDISFPKGYGHIDVTRPPYNAKGDGVTDDTDAINRALRDHNRAANDEKVPGHRLQAWTIYFPAGTYLVSDTLIPRDPNDPEKSQNAVRLVGAGRDRTTIRLADHAPKFQNPKQTRYVVQTGNENGDLPNWGFANFIQHLTVDTGSGNPGASGIRFDASNLAAIENVRIRSGAEDGGGVHGLALLQQGGLAFGKNLIVEGFNHGIFADQQPLNNFALENIELSGQSLSGIENVGKNIQLRRVRSRNAVPALVLKSPTAAVVLDDSQFVGTGSGPAIRMDSYGFLFVRDLEVTGYEETIALPETSGLARPAGLQPAPAPSGLSVGEWVSHPRPGAVPGEALTLRLPVKETPTWFPDAQTRWANATEFGAVSGDGIDDTAAIQAAIDSGAEAVFLPRGDYVVDGDLVVRGAVRLLDGAFSSLHGKGSLTVGESAHPEVFVENFLLPIPFIHNSTSTVVLRNRAWFGDIRTGPEATGDLFIESAGPKAELIIDRPINVWVRALNREQHRLENNGGTVWLFGDNVERMQNKQTKKNQVVPIATRNGGATEVMGGAIDPLHIPHFIEDGPLFLVEDGDLSFTFAGAAYLRPSEGTIGTWPNILEVRKGNDTTRLTDAQSLIFKANPDAPGERIVFPPTLIRRATPSGAITP